MPTLSHRGDLLAWVTVVPLASGYVETVTIGLRDVCWTP
jgi:hypothetical protein